MYSIHKQLHFFAEELEREAKQYKSYYRSIMWCVVAIAHLYKILFYISTPSRMSSLCAFALNT